MVNKNKSFFLVFPKTHPSVIAAIKRITGFSHSSFSFIYLGCPIYRGRKKISFFDHMVGKVINRTEGWKDKLLSVGCRTVLIKSVNPLPCIPSLLFIISRPILITLKRLLPTSFGHPMTIRDFTTRFLGQTCVFPKLKEVWDLEVYMTRATPLPPKLGGILEQRILC